MITNLKWSLAKQALNDLVGDYERAQVDDPQWHMPHKVHDWRNHVPDYVQKRWNRLDADAKLCVFVMAAKLAFSEEWE